MLMQRLLMVLALATATAFISTAHENDTCAAGSAGFNGPKGKAPSLGGTQEEQSLFNEVMGRLLQTRQVRDNVPPGMSWPPVTYIKPNSDKELQAEASTVVGIDGVVYTRAWISEGMIRKLKQDQHAIAAIMGHELTHLLKKHPGYGTQKEVVGLAVSREHELEADLEGIKIAVAAGYMDEGGPKFLKALMEGLGERPHFARLKVTHPSMADRLQLLDRNRAHLWKAMAAFDNGVFFLDNEQFRSAESCFEIVTKVFPESVEGWTNLGYARLMQYCDALEEKDLRKLGIGQIAAGCFYKRPAGLVPTRGVDAALWNKAVKTLQKALDLDTDKSFSMARANLGTAYLVSPDGKPDVKKALEYFAAVDRNADKGTYFVSVDAYLINYAVAEIAAGKSERAMKRLLSTTRLLNAGQYNEAMLLARSEKVEEKKKAFTHLANYLHRESFSSAWWPMAFELYTRLGKELDLPAKNREEFMKGIPVPRTVTQVEAAPGKVITLSDKTADVLKLLGKEKQIGVPVYRNAKVYRFMDVTPGIDVIGGDRIVTIFLTSTKSPAVTVQLAGMGSPKKELRVGMSTNDFKKNMVGMQYDVAPRVFDAEAVYYASYPNLGLSFRFADGRVYEIAIAQVPLSR